MSISFVIQSAQITAQYELRTISFYKKSEERIPVVRNQLSQVTSTLYALLTQKS